MPVTHRRWPLFRILLGFVTGVLATSSGVSAQSLPLHPGQWTLSKTGSFEAWTDRRGLLVLHHPWAVSEKGFSAAAEQSVTIPDDWRGPVRIHFYVSDDYVGSMEPVTEGWLGQINLPGHRFKEVLVNDEVVWRRDVADAADVAEPTRFAVDLSETVTPGSMVRIAVRLFDEAGSMERLPGDHRYIGTTDNITKDDPWKFMTNVYVGDIVLTPATNSTVAPRAMPSADLARAEHGDAWPLAPASTPATYPIQLKVDPPTSGHVTAVVQCGIPFPAGALMDPAHIRLTDTNGTPIPTASHTLNTWPRGSIRIAKVTALLPPGCREVLLHIDGNSTPPQPPDGGVKVSITESGNDAFAVTLANGANQIQDLTGEYSINGETATLALESVETLEESPLHRDVEARGRVRSRTTDFGRFVLRMSTFAGQPYVRIFHRFFNDTPGTLDVTRMRLRLPQPDAVPSQLPDGPVMRITQADAESWTVQRGPGDFDAKDGHAPPWFHTSSPAGATGLSAVVRHFSALHPIAQGFEEGALVIDLIAPTEKETAYQPHEGEARRHEIWLALWDDTTPPDKREPGATWMANPPRLFNADYFCATGAYGMAAPHDDTRFPELTAFVQQTYGEIPASRFYTTGIRHFGDLPYNVEENTWRNGYYDTQQGLFSEYLMTGDHRWFQHLEAVVRHIIDIDVCHASADHPDWVGAIHGYYGTDHSTAAPWAPMQRTKGTLNYWRLTGDRDARDAALAVADSAIASGRAVGAGSVRDHAGTLYALVAAWDETHDPNYLDGAKRLAHDAMTRIDFRRGTYAEVHGNYSYRGNVPWMVAQLMEPMYDYYRASGDVKAAEAVVVMAESILAENRTRGVPGDIYGYSHNPHFTKSSSYHILIAPAILYAKELTGDDEFLRQGRALYEQTIAEGTVNAIMNCYWNTHTLLYFLDRYKNNVTD